DSTNGGAITQINGVWVNSQNMSCAINNSVSRTCPPQSCTYLGTFYTTVAGQTVQQFGPVSGTGGGGPCLCLYNAYNRVPLTSRSLDSVGYTYSSGTWRLMHASSGNRVTVVDGLGQMQPFAQLTDLLSASGLTAEMGID